MAVAVAALSSGSATAFVGSSASLVSKSAQSRSSALSMVLEKPKEKKISKLEQLKVDSDHLIHPLKEVRPVVVCFSLSGWTDRKLK